MLSCALGRRGRPRQQQQRDRNIRYIFIGDTGACGAWLEGQNGPLLFTNACCVDAHPPSARRLSRTSVMHPAGTHGTQQPGAEGWRHREHYQVESLVSARVSALVSAVSRLPS